MFTSWDKEQNHFLLPLSFWLTSSELQQTQSITFNNDVVSKFENQAFNKAFSSIQSLSPVQLFATQWIAACQASLSITNSRSLHKLMSIESVMPSSHLILCRPLFLLTPIPPSIRVFSNESTLRMRWPKYWSFSISIIPSKEHPGLISFRWTGWISLQSKGLSRVFSNTACKLKNNEKLLCGHS